MNLGSWKIDDYLTFTCNTHNAAGAETDADADPTYRIYEDETGTPILTGTMSKLDDANTTGFYSEQITLSAANGLEKGKSYSIRMKAIVGGTTGILIDTFQIEAEVDANTVSPTVSADLISILGTALTETAGQISAAFKKFFNVAAPTATALSLPDAVPGAAGGLPTTDGTNLNQPPANMALDTTVAKEATLGTPAGASVSTDIAAIQVVVDGLQVAPRGVALVPFVFVMRDSNFLPRTGLTVTGTISKDGGAFGGIANPIEEVGKGSYRIPLGLTLTEMAATLVDLCFEAPGAMPTKILIKTQE